MKKRDMWFPLSVAFVLMVIGIAIGYYVISLMGEKSYRQIPLSEEYTLNVGEEAWISDDQNINIIEGHVTHVTLKQPYMFYRRVIGQDGVEVGYYDIERKHTGLNTAESYEELQKELETTYGVTFVPIEEYFEP